MVSELEELRESILSFQRERDWEKYNTPKEIVFAMVSEVGELTECYRWLNEHESSKLHLDPAKKQKIEEEIADIMIYLISLAHQSNVDLKQAIHQKLEKNRKKYPVEQSKGVHSNPLTGFKGRE